MNLSRTEKAILGYVGEYLDGNGYAPSRLEIARANSIQPLTRVQCYLNSLRTKGHIDWNPGECRTIRVLRGPEGV